MNKRKPNIETLRKRVERVEAAFERTYERWERARAKYSNDESVLIKIEETLKKKRREKEAAREELFSHPEYK